jgi:16S rRNA processing protein RimM
VSERLVAIGEIMRPHGLAGTLRIKALTDRPERFERLTDCIVWDPDADVRARRVVEGVSRQRETILLKLAGVNGVAEASALIGRLVAVPEGDALPLPKGQFYPWQLAGCRVETEDGTSVGIVTGIEHGPAQDLWVVAAGGRERLIPAVPEIVVAVDLGARRVVIRPPEGLLEL